MAARFWVTGGTGNWSSTTNWSASSGGASGASVPGTADTATFNASSGAGTATVDSNVTIQTLTMTGFTGTLAFGTNSISLNSTGTVYTGATTFAVTGTPVINVTSSGSTAITVTPTATTEANSISFNFTGGSYALTLTAGSYRNLIFTGYAGTVANSTITIYGNLNFSTGMTRTAGTSIWTFGATSGVKTITTNGKTLDFPITFDGVGGTWQLQDALTLGSSRAVTLTNGTLDLFNKSLTCDGFFCSNSNIRTLAFGTGSITVTGTGTSFTTTASTNLTITGTPVVNVTNSTATATSIQPGSSVSESNCISFNFTAGTYALSMIGNVLNVNFTGFAGSWGNGTRTIYGNLILSSGMTLASGTSVTTFGATSGTKTITSNGKTLDFPITFDGVGGTWQLQDALTMGSGRTLTHTNGTINLNGNTLTVGTAYTTATGTKNLTFNGGALVCPAASTTAFNNAAPTGYTTTAGTGTGKISMTAATAKTFVGGGSTFNCTLSNDGAGALTITGSNTFGDLTTTVRPSTITVTSGTTQTFQNFSLSGTAGNLVTVAPSSTTNYSFVKSGAVVNTDYLSISRCTATPSTTTWYIGANSTDGGNNTGLIFTAAPAGGYTISFAITEPQDTAAIGITAQTSAALAATDPPDSVNITLLFAITASLGATENTDTAAIVLTAKTTASLAATENTDTAAISANVSDTSFVSLNATELTDSVSIAITAVPISTASLAVTEAQDTAAITVNFLSTASLDATDAQDTAAISASVYYAVSLAATEAQDTVSISLKKIWDVDASTISVSSVTATGQAVYLVSSSSNVVSIAQAAAIRVFSGTASTTSVSYATASARFLWEMETSPTGNWTPQTAASQSWTNLNSGSDPWQRI
jgi:hypothetical protein